MQVIIHYTPTGLAITEWNFQRELYSLCESYDRAVANPQRAGMIRSYSTFAGICLIRHAIKIRSIPFDQVEVKWGDHNMYFNRCANITIWPLMLGKYIDIITDLFFLNSGYEQQDVEDHTFKLSDENLAGVIGSLDETGGYLIKESELRYWIETFVNRERNKLRA